MTDRTQYQSQLTTNPFSFFSFSFQFLILSFFPSLRTSLTCNVQSRSLCLNTLSRFFFFLFVSFATQQSRLTTNEPKSEVKQESAIVQQQTNSNIDNEQPSLLLLSSSSSSLFFQRFPSIVHFSFLQPICSLQPLPFELIGKIIIYLYIFYTYNRSITVVVDHHNTLFNCN